MSYSITRRRFLQAAGASISLPFLSQLMAACSAVAPNMDQPLKEIEFLTGRIGGRPAHPRPAAHRRAYGRRDQPLHLPDQLFDFAPDRSSNWLGSKFTSNAEGTLWTVKMNDTTKFHDGSPVTSADVKFTSLDHCTRRSRISALHLVP